jgi:hypothetical protein
MITLGTSDASSDGAEFNHSEHDLATESKNQIEIDNAFHNQEQAKGKGEPVGALDGRQPKDTSDEAPDEALQGSNSVGVPRSRKGSGLLRLCCS